MSVLLWECMSVCVTYICVCPCVCVAGKAEVLWEVAAVWHGRDDSERCTHSEEHICTKKVGECEFIIIIMIVMVVPSQPHQWSPSLSVFTSPKCVCYRPAWDFSVVFPWLPREILRAREYSVWDTPGKGNKRRGKTEVDEKIVEGNPW